MVSTFSATTSARITCDTELDCMAQAIYFEARGELTAGQIAVGQVIMNRVRSNRFPNSVKEVVWQPRQFSYTHDGKHERMLNEEAKRKAYTIATLVLTGEFIVDTIDLADHYFNDKLVDPEWSKKMIYIGRVGDHVFYKAKQTKKSSSS